MRFSYRYGEITPGWIVVAPGSDVLHVRERFHRENFGHIDVQVTINDPKAYAKPWTVTLPFTLFLDGAAITETNKEKKFYETRRSASHRIGSIRLPSDR